MQNDELESMVKMTLYEASYLIEKKEALWIWGIVKEAISIFAQNCKDMSNDINSQIKETAEMHIFHWRWMKLDLTSMPKLCNELIYEDFDVFQDLLEFYMSETTVFSMGKNYNICTDPQ